MVCNFTVLNKTMNLIIDVGNSFVKLAVFQDSELVVKKTIKPDVIIKHIDILRKEHKTIEKAIISSVGKLKEKDVRYIKKYVHLVELNSKTALPFKNCYETPNTLGVDRMALVSASVQQFPNNNVLVIDAGTCITYDFVTNKNEYLGGAISPGIDMRYKSLNNLTANLPLLEKEMPHNIVGASTNSSIHSGVVNGVLKEMDGIIETYQQEYSDLTVILTGGDCNFLSKQLKSSIFANSNFLLEGLNYILQFNSNE
jgi:type III pantothenate kinase